ncbi:hypothetical protein VCRA2116O29_10220 [Vibrio crassostreae]|nr:hypothetical protein VCRA2116O29_10220 [Vibrio crassostreae]CAK2486625.1 hypothetical protein VCRA2119O48_30008 [Vibrio crassostreae]CAK3112185.1 hypothetical protein VCRA213O314_100008 [Vibrio crassostreae]CAK3661771.1 hypothetical protein VCRA2123O74_10008 [Vibrio crassostreae]
METPIASVAMGGNLVVQYVRSRYVSWVDKWTLEPFNLLICNDTPIYCTQPGGRLLISLVTFGEK